MTGLAHIAQCVSPYVDNHNQSHFHALLAVHSSFFSHRLDTSFCSFTHKQHIVPQIIHTAHQTDACVPLSVLCIKWRQLNTQAINSYPTCALLQCLPKSPNTNHSFIHLSLLTDNPIQLKSVVLSLGIMAIAHTVVHKTSFCYTDN